MLDTFPVCLLPVSQNSKCLHNGRKLELASCVVETDREMSPQASNSDRPWLKSSDSTD